MHVTWSSTASYMQIICTIICPTLITIYGANDTIFCYEIEVVQYKATAAITGAITGTAEKKLCEELGLKSLKFRSWYRRLCTLFKIKMTGLPFSLSKYVLKGNHQPLAFVIKVLQHINVELILLRI